jgi:hypothetical protein
VSLQFKHVQIHGISLAIIKDVFQRHGDAMAMMIVWTTQTKSVKTVRLLPALILISVVPLEDVYQTLSNATPTMIVETFQMNKIARM